MTQFYNFKYQKRRNETQCKQKEGNNKDQNSMKQKMNSEENQIKTASSLKRLIKFVRFSD